MVYGEHEASFHFIVEMFNYFSTQPYSPTPKLTSTHINPAFWQKMSVSLAAQVMSSSVVCGLGKIEIIVPHTVKDNQLMSSSYSRSFNHI